MSENVVINGTTYNGVETLTLVRADGTAVTFYPDAVRYNAQNLTEAQKAQARQNMGVGSIDEVADEVLARLQTPVFGTVDVNKHITLSGHLVDGTYTMSFEDTDGTVIDLCEVQKNSNAPAYTNLRDTYLVAKDMRFSYTNGAPWTKSCVGMALFVIPFADLMEKTLRVKAPNIANQTADAKGTSFNGVSNNTTFVGFIFNQSSSTLANATCAVNEGNNTYSFLFNKDNVTSSYNTSNVMYMQIVVNTTGTAVTDDELEQIVITIDEPIV